MRVRSVRRLADRAAHLLTRLERLEPNVERPEKEIVPFGDRFGPLRHFPKQPVAPLRERVLEADELDEEQTFLLGHAEQQTAKDPFEP